MPSKTNTTTPVNMFECSICCTEGKETKKFTKIECPGCEYTVCSPCQKTYAKIECMNCHAQFVTAFAIEKLGVTFVTHTARQTVLKELMAIQRAELDTIGELVEWTKMCNEIRRNSRYGLEIQHLDENGRYTSGGLPKKPVRRIAPRVLCPCPVNDCRGSVIVDRCNICAVQVCTECLFKITADAAHVCDPNIVASVKDIRESTKPCPRCQTLIHKTEGCDHMNCTNCGIHFSWTHGNILSNSSNHHYTNRMIRQNIQSVGAAADAADNQVCAVSIEHDRIPESVIRDLIESKSDIIIDDSILESLYEVTKAVRHLKRSEYYELTISANSRERYDELQVKYALNEITEKSWEQYVYKTHIKQQSYELIAGILHIYIANMDGFQSELFNALNQDLITLEFVDYLKYKINQLTDIINQNIREIRDEYDPTNTKILVIRRIGETTIGFCSKQPIAKEPKEKKVKAVKAVKAEALTEGPVLENIVVSTQPIRREIQLYPYQIDHVNKLCGFLDKYHYAVDLSPLGTGKTYTAAKVYRDKGLAHIVTISPPSVKTKWLEVNEAYRLDCDNNLTYGEVTGKRFINPKSGYLLRNDYRVPVLQENGTTRMIDKYNYTVTDAFKTIVNEGLLLVLDEFQHLKNECAQTEACEMLIQTIYDDFKRGGKSRVILLSGSPIDKQNQVVRLFKTLGIMRHDKIVSGYQYAGINEIEDYINQTFRDTSTGNRYVELNRASYISSRLDRNNNTLLLQSAYRSEVYAYRLFINVIKPNVSSTMDIRHMQNTGISLRKYNGQFHLNNEANEQRVNQALEDLNKITDLRVRLRQQQRNADDPNAGSMMAAVVRALTVIETSKIDTFYRLAKKDLDFDPNKKIVIGVNYSATLKDLVALLAEYNPLIIDGSKSIKARRAILDKFQAPTSEYRLLIGNISVISTGIDLDDKHGEFPRTCYVSPNYNTIHIYQLGHRFMRGLDTKSDADIFMVYSANRYERRVMESLMSKGQVMKSITREQAEAGIVFPCDYQTYEEPQE